MNISIQVSILLEIAVIFSCILLIGILVVTKLLPVRISKFGILLLTCIAFISFFYLTINLGWVSIAKALIWLFIPSTLALGYWFYKFNTEWYSKKSKVDFFIFIIPVIVFATAVAIELLFSFYPENKSIYNVRIGFTEYSLLFLFPIYSLIVIATNIYKIRKAEANNVHYYSNFESINLKAAKISLLFFGFFLIGMVTSELTGPFISEFIFNLSFLGLTFYLGYFEFKVIANYLQIAKSVVVEVNIEESPIVEEKSKSSSNELFQKINTIVSEEKLFLKPDLSLYDLGQKMNLNIKILSQAINSEEDLNFNKFINEKRINYAADLLKTPEYNKYSIEGIANESGFRSKSTFNTSFKSFKYCTPSEYRSRSINN